MDSLNHDNHADDIKACNSTSRYLDDLLNISYVEGLIKQIYPPELQLNKAFCNLLGLLESAIMLRTSMHEINV